MFGSNWPVDVVYSNYLATIDAYPALITDAGLTRAEQTGLLASNAEAFYRI